MRLIAERFRQNLLLHFMYFVDCVRSCTLGGSEVKSAVRPLIEPIELAKQIDITKDYAIQVICAYEI